MKIIHTPYSVYQLQPTEKKIKTFHWKLADVTKSITNIMFELSNVINTDLQKTYYKCDTP